MAKKVWTLSEDGMTMTRIYEGDVKDLTVKLVDLFPLVAEYDTAQKGCIVNGTKQKLSDTIARSKDEQLTEAEKREAQETLWNRMKDDREWNLPSSGKRAGMVSTKSVIPAMLAEGMKPSVIAKVLGKTLEEVQTFVVKKTK